MYDVEAIVCNGCTELIPGAHFLKNVGTTIDLQKSALIVGSDKLHLKSKQDQILSVPVCRVEVM